MQVRFKLDRTEPTLGTSSSGFPTHHYSSSGETQKTNVSYLPVVAEFWGKKRSFKRNISAAQPPPERGEGISLIFLHLPTGGRQQPFLFSLLLLLLQGCCSSAETVQLESHGEPGTSWDDPGMVRKGWDVLLLLRFAVLPAAGAPLPALVAEPLGFPLEAASFPWHVEKP